MSEGIRERRDDACHICDSIQESRPKSYQTFWSLAAPQVPSAIRGSKLGRSGHETRVAVKMEEPEVSDRSLG